jgi:N-acetylglutamate synthase-like GNAT family acetyltransferase
MLSELISSRATTLLVAESDGRIIGCCALTIRQSDRTASFGLLAVDPLVQGGAVGSQLLEAAEHQATSSGCIRVELDVIDVRTELVAWYRRRGFAPTGTTRPFPYGDERFGLPKRADLQFMTLSKSLTPSTHVTAEP